MGKTFRYDGEDNYQDIPERKIHSPKSKAVRGDGRMDRILARRERNELKQSLLTEANK